MPLCLKHSPIDVHVGFPASPRFGGGDFRCFFRFVQWPHPDGKSPRKRPDESRLSVP